MTAKPFWNVQAVFCCAAAPEGSIAAHAKAVAAVRATQDRKCDRIRFVSSSKKKVPGHESPAGDRMIVTQRELSVRYV
jgi:hypothetical protein